VLARDESVVEPIKQQKKGAVAAENEIRRPKNGDAAGIYLTKGKKLEEGGVRPFRSANGNVWETNRVKKQRSPPRLNIR